MTQMIASRKLKGIERLRAIQKMRKTTGIGQTFEFNQKKFNKLHAGRKVS